MPTSRFPAERASVGPTLDVDPTFREALVWRALTHLDAAGRPASLTAHHRRAAAVYGQPDVIAQRSFTRLAEAEFAELGLAAPIERAFAERPALAARVRHVLIAEAQGRGQEGVTCDGRTVGLRLPAARFDDPAGLLAWCRHALGHTEDTLDAEFGFVPGWDGSPADGAVVSRLHALWDVSVDGRLSRIGHLAAERVRPRHEAAIAALLPALTPAAVTALVGRLWERPRPSFGDLECWATHPEVLAIDAGSDTMAVPGAPLPEGRCVLCGFPSHDLRIPAEPIAAAALGEFPGWRPESGLCGRCEDRYLFLARVRGTG